MAYTPIDKSSDYINTVLYNGTGNSTAVTGVGFQPDWVWVKCRSSGNSNSYAHVLTDVVRGVNKTLFSNETDGEVTNHAKGYLSAFGTDGFTVTGEDGTSASGETYASWNWKAGGSASNNTDGDITASVSANATAGFSIGSYNTSAMGSASSTYTIGHGLSSAPTMVIVKPYSTSDDWYVYHQGLGNAKYIRLNVGAGGATTNASTWGSTTPTSSVFSIGTGFWGVNSVQNVFYAFADVKGYSKMGSYTGNGDADGTFVYTGFKPAWTMIKKTTGDNWTVNDNKRNPFNLVNKNILANHNHPESTSGASVVDYLSNGMKMRGSDASHNGSGDEYIYAAFAENPFATSTGIPGLAR